MRAACMVVVLCACERPVTPELRIAGPFVAREQLRLRPEDFEASRRTEVTTMPPSGAPQFHALYRGMYRHRWGVRVVDSSGRVCRDASHVIEDDGSRTNPSGYGALSQPLFETATQGPCTADNRVVAGSYTATFTLDGRTVATRQFSVTP